MGFQRPLPLNTRNNVERIFFWSKIIDELQKKRHVGECLLCVENKAHVHTGMLCVYGPTC